MINNWRSVPSRPPAPQAPQPEPHIWDQVSKEQLAKMNEAGERTASMVTAMTEGKVPGQASTMDNYQQMREAMGRGLKVFE